MKNKLAYGLQAFVLALGLGAVPALAQETGTTTTAPATTPAAIEIKDFSIGAEDAKIKMVEYASFTCPHCANFHADVFKQLKTEYIDTGKVQFTYKEVYFDRYGLWAAMMARCGGDMRYFGISEILFDTQKEWAGSEDPAVVVENLKKIGLAAGMDGAALDVCMKDGAMAEAMVAHFEKGMADDGVEGTPTIFINGVKHPNMSYDEMKAILETELAK